MKKTDQNLCPCAAYILMGRRGREEMEDKINESNSWFVTNAMEDSGAGKGNTSPRGQMWAGCGFK